MALDENLELQPLLDAADDEAKNGDDQLFIRRDWDEVPTDALKEPGGAIPDLPVWDEPDTAFRHPPQPAHNEPLRRRPRERDESAAPFAPALTMRATVSLVECTKLCEQLAHEWRALALIPTLEDVVLRAAARAFREVGGNETRVALRRIDGGSEQLALGPAEGGQSFCEAVAALSNAPREGAEAGLVVTSFLATGVEQADPRLDGGFFALTIGDERVALVLERGATVPGPVTTLSLAYAPESVPEGVAAALLGRIRELVEAPYALLAG